MSSAYTPEQLEELLAILGECEVQEVMIQRVDEIMNHPAFPGLEGAVAPAYYTQLCNFRQAYQLPQKDLVRPASGASTNPNLIHHVLAQVLAQIFATAETLHLETLPIENSPQRQIFEDQLVQDLRQCLSGFHNTMYTRGYQAQQK